MHSCYGITGPICVDLPKEKHLIETRKLLDTMESYDVYENSVELQHKEMVVERLGFLFGEWVKEMAIEMDMPDMVTEKVGGKIFPFGSCALGVHSKGADIDALCVGPGFLQRKAFFTSFLEKLKAQKEVKDIEAIEEAYVPVIKLSWEEIEIDLVFALVTQRSLPDDLDLLKNDIVKNIDKHRVRSLDGYRVTKEILRLVPNVCNFRSALRAIRLWAKRRYIYSNKLGFLRGVSWAIMVARICQAYPDALASTLVIKFFKVFSMWVWPVPIHLKVVENCNYNLPFWNPRQNTSLSVSPSTFAIISEEIRRGHAICQEIRQNKENWSELFEEMHFFEKYQHYAVLEASYTTDKQHLEWVRLVESKISLLVASLERNGVVSLVHVHLRSYPGPGRANKEDGKSTMWQIGLVLNEKWFQRERINLNSSFQNFANFINSLAKCSNLYEERMSFSTAYMLWEDLIYIPPVSARKRRKEFHKSKMPAKKYKDNQV